MNSRPNVGELIVKEVGKGLIVTWKLDFFSLAKEGFSSILSPHFSFGIEKCHLEIWSSSNPASRIILRCVRSLSFEDLSTKLIASFAAETASGRKAFRPTKGVFQRPNCNLFDTFISKSDWEKLQLEFMASGCLKIFCVLQKSSGSAGTSTDEKCFCCKENVGADVTSLDEKCIQKPVKCPDCSDVVPLKSWLNGHQCQATRTEKCFYCKKNVDADSIKMHEEKCMERTLKCPACSGLVPLKDWLVGGQKKETKECSHCKKNVEAGIISMHEKKCMDRPIKCPECSEVVLLQKWHDHQCQTAGDDATAGRSNSKRSSDADTSPPCKKKKCVNFVDCFPLVDSPIENVKGRESLGDDFKRVLLNGTNHDVILKTADRELRAHEDIIKARSRVFESILNYNRKNGSISIIDARDCDSDAMEQLLFYIYSGRVEKLHPSNMIPLYYVADKYEMKDLKEICREFIKQSHSPSNFCKIIQLSVNHSDSDLQDFATEYFVHNMLDILRTVEWQSFLKDHSTVANKLLIESCEKRN